MLHVDSFINLHVVCVWISLILLKIKNNKKLFSNYCLLLKLLFICLFILFMFHEQDKRALSWKKKKKKKRSWNAKRVKRGREMRKTNVPVVRDGNFAPPRLTRPSPLRPVRVFPAPQRWWGGDGWDFRPAPRGRAGMGLHFLSPLRPIPAPH